MGRDWMSEEVVAAILDALGAEEMHLTQIAAGTAGLRPELVARHVGVVAADGLLSRREVDGRDLYTRVAAAVTSAPA